MCQPNKCVCVRDGEVKTLKGWKMQTGKQRKPQEMKGKRGDVADRHMLAVSGEYCVC